MMRIIYLLWNIVYLASIFGVSVLYLCNVDGLAVMLSYMIFIGGALSPVIPMMYVQAKIVPQKRIHTVNIGIKAVTIVYFGGIIELIGKWNNQVSIIIVICLAIGDLYVTYKIMRQLSSYSVSYSQIKSILQIKKGNSLIITTMTSRMIGIIFSAGIITNDLWEEQILVWTIIILIEIYYTRKLIQLSKFEHIKDNILKILFVIWSLLIVSCMLDFYNIGGIITFGLIYLSHYIINLDRCNSIKETFEDKVSL